MRNPTLVHGSSALTAFDIKSKGLREAIERALHHEDQEFALTSWCDALSSASEEPKYLQRNGSVEFRQRFTALAY
jgi:hypothetical protein